MPLNPSPPPARLILFGLLLVLALVVSACAGATPSPSPGTPIPAQPSSTPSATASPTASPSPTPLVERLILLAPPEADLRLALELEALVQEQASQAGLVAERRAALSSSDLVEAQVRLVVALPPAQQMAELAAGAPGIQFLAVGFNGLVPGPNLSVLGTQGLRPDWQGFLAGYLAAIITTDWRVGVISTGASPAGAAARLGFLNGARYFCGLCRPVRPPFVEYPLFVEVAPGPQPDQWRPAADLVIEQGVQTVFIAPEAASEPLLGYLSDAGLTIIGGSPPPGPIGQNWAATVLPDPVPAALGLFPDLLLGTGGVQAALPYRIQDVNPELVTPGRLRLAEAMVGELLEGVVDTGVDPNTGLPR